MEKSRFHISRISKYHLFALILWIITSCFIAACGRICVIRYDLITPNSVDIIRETLEANCKKHAGANVQFKESDRGPEYVPRYYCKFFVESKQKYVYFTMMCNDSSIPTDRATVYIKAVGDDTSTKTDCVIQPGKRQFDSYTVFSTIKNFEKEVLNEKDIAYSEGWMDNFISYFCLIYLEYKYSLLLVILLSWIVFTQTKRKTQ